MHKKPEEVSTNITDAIAILSHEVKSIRFDMERSIVDLTSTIDDYCDGMSETLRKYKSDITDVQTESNARMLKFRDELAILSDDCLRTKQAEKIFLQIHNLLQLQDQSSTEIVMTVKSLAKDLETHLQTSIDNLRRELTHKQ